MLCVVFGCCACIRDFYSAVHMGELFYKTSPVIMDVLITIVQFLLQTFLFMDATSTSVYNFQVRRSRCVDILKL